MFRTHNCFLSALTLSFLLSCSSDPSPEAVSQGTASIEYVTRAAPTQGKLEPTQLTDVQLWAESESELASLLAKAWSVEGQKLTEFKDCDPDSLHLVFLNSENSLSQIPKDCRASLVLIPIGNWSEAAQGRLYWSGFHIVNPQQLTARFVSPPSAQMPTHQAVALLWQLHNRFELPAVQDWPAVDMPPLKGLSGSDNLSDLRDLFYAPDLPDQGPTLLRLAAAKSGQSLVDDQDPWVRARSMLNVDSAEILQSGLADGSSLVRLATVQQLVRLSHAKASPELEALLVKAAGHTDAYMRWKAAYGLRHYSSAVPLLQNLLWDPDIDVQREAALSLGHIADPSSITALQRTAQSPNAFVRRWAVAALANIEAADTSVFEAALQDPSRLVALEAHRALQARGQKPSPMPPYQPPSPPKDIEAHRALLQDPDPTVRKDALKFYLLNPPQASELEPYLKDSDSDVRKLATTVLGWIPESQAYLLNLLQDTDPDVLVTALCALARQPLTELRPLLSWTNHPDAEVRLRAIEALAAVEGSEAEMWLAKHAEDADERIRAAVVKRLPGRMRSEEHALWVRCSAMAGGAALEDLWCPHQESDWGYFGRGVIEAEDAFLHEIFSWNSPEEQPESYRLLRPRSYSGYGQPDRG